MYLLVVSAAIFVCCLSIMAATIRLGFGMARDNQLPASKALARVAPSLHTPIWTCIAIAVLAAVPFLQYCRRRDHRDRGDRHDLLQLLPRQPGDPAWPGCAAGRGRGPFKLGRWGILVNVIGLLYGAAMLVNFAWPRPASNPQPKQTVIGGAQVLDFHIGFLNDIPILWTVVDLHRRWSAPSTT